MDQNRRRAFRRRSGASNESAKRPLDRSRKILSAEQIEVQSLKSVMTSMLSPAPLGNAAIISGPGRIDVKTLEFREPAAGELRVQIEGCGVCASNLPVWEGKPWFDYPFEPGAPGHEAWGRLDAIGEGVTGFKRGDRVALLSSHAYAEFDFARTSEVVPLPTTLEELAFPAEPLD